LKLRIKFKRRTIKKGCRRVPCVIHCAVIGSLTIWAGPIGFGPPLSVSCPQRHLVARVESKGLTRFGTFFRNQVRNRPIVGTRQIFSVVCVSTHGCGQAVDRRGQN
jgi:hypothetical protein